MEVQSQLLLEATKHDLTAIQLRVLVAAVLTKDQDPTAIMAWTGLKRFRVEAALKSLVNKGVLPQRGRDIRSNINNNNINTSILTGPLPQRGNNAPFTVLTLLARTFNREPYYAPRELEAAKRLYGLAYTRCQGQEPRDFQAFGLLLDFFQHKASTHAEFFGKEARLPATILAKDFPSYLKLVPAKDLDTREWETIRGYRMAYNVATKQWKRTNDPIPTSIEVSAGRASGAE